MNINTSNYWSASSASSHGFSGLVSGLDTEKMVEQMLMGTQKKIDAQKGLQQTTSWRQEMYRDIITSINTFRDKYFNTSFGASSNMNFASSAFFNTMKASLISGSGVNVIGADSSALTGDMKIKVQQLAEAAKLKGETTVSQGNIVGAPVDAESLKEALSKEITIKLSDGAEGDLEQTKEVKVDLQGAKTQEEMLEKINQALKDAGQTDISASIKNGTLSFNVGKDSTMKIVGIESSELGGKMTGLTSTSTTTDADGNTIVSAGGLVDMNASLSFTVDLDGMQKNIQLDNLEDFKVNGEITLKSVSDAINDKLDKAFGKNVITTKVSEFSNPDGTESEFIQFGFAEGYNKQGHSFRLTGMDLTKIGVVPGSSSNVSYSTKLSSLQGASGGVYEFEINGKQFTFDEDATVGDLINTVNSSGAGVKLSYSQLEDKFVLESASTGANYDITMSQSTGNILSVLFGDSVINAGSKAGSDTLTTGAIQGNALKGDEKIGQAAIKFTVNGNEYTFSLPKKDEEADPNYYTAQEFSDEFNKYLKEKFGDNNISYDQASGQLKINKPGYEVNVVDASVIAGAEDENGVFPKIDLGLTGKNNLATAETNIDDVLNLSDREKQALKGLGGNGTLGDLKGDVSFEKGHLIVTKAGAENYLPDLMKNVQFGDGKLADGKTIQGKDAIVTINGVETTRSSNTFTVDGVTIELTGVTGDEEAVIGTTRDVDKIIEGFESFVKDYNELIDKLYGYTDADPEYRKYPPLTDAQKKEMSDREIELWEEKAKTGLLRRDSDVEHFLSEMRIALYERPAGCKFALYDIGIETGEYTEKGKLHIDTAKLKSALAEDPASVEQLFLDATDGLSNKLIDVMKETANPSSGSPGTLVQLAGAKGYGSEGNNTLTQKLKDIDERIKDLQRKYEKEKNRYWNQFNKMEQILANFNAQSGMIQSQFMGMGY